jgi:hypothetical protein
MIYRPKTADAYLKMHAAVDDESSQDNEKHNCGGDRPPVIFAPPWVGPPAVAKRATNSVFEA